MKRSIELWQLMGFAVTSLGGTLLHFLYELTDEAIWIAPFSGVNESTWEHMKLFFWPAFIFAIAESLSFRNRSDLWCIKLRGIVLGLMLIPVIFYTYNGAIGKSPDWVNIAIFFIATAATYIYEARLFRRDDLPCRFPTLSILALVAIAILFIIFTFATPEIGIFRDPLTGEYGL